MLTITPENISGFVVADGCFYADSGYDKEYRLGYQVRLALSIELREDDREILEAIQTQLGCGRIYKLDFGRYKNYKEKGWRPHVKYRVGGFKQIRDKVIPFFKKYPLFGRKKKSFDIFCKIADMIDVKKHLTKDGLKQILALKHQLQAINKKGNKDSLDARDALVQWERTLDSKSPITARQAN